MSGLRPIIVATGLSRTYLLGAEEINALQGVDLTLYPGEFVAVVGRSGSGKTTLLNVLAGLDRPSGGEVLFEGRELTAMSEDALTDLRRHSIGFVFQTFGLLPLLSAFENVELPSPHIGSGSGRAGAAHQGGARNGRAVAAAGAPSLRALRR